MSSFGYGLMEFFIFACEFFVVFIVFAGLCLQMNTFKYGRAGVFAVEFLWVG